MSRKIYFLVSEIIPFSETSDLAHFARYVPIRLQEHKHDIRLTSPKYGFISERKYTLREVIRLREIECEMNGDIVMASAKSAFIPKTRVQVYFMEHPDWFQPLNPLLYKSRNGRPLSDNDERFAFFSKTALCMLTHLFWSPDVILCNDWQSASVPIVYKQLFADKDFYKGIKTVQLLHSLDDYAQVSAGIYDKLGVKVESSGGDGESRNSLVVACQSADLVITIDRPGSEISKELSTHPDFESTYKDVEAKLRAVSMKDASEENCRAAADEINTYIEELFA